MRKRLLPDILLWVGIPALLFTSCVNDKYLSLPPAVANQSFVEEFDTVLNAYNRGWRFINRSMPIGPSNWQQGKTLATYNAFSSKGNNAGFIESTFNATAGTTPNGGGIISNWLVSPLVTMQNGDKIIFYTRTGDPTYVDRLQVRINPFNQGLNVGSGFDAGDFETVLLDVNPFYSAVDPIAFPNNWTRYEATVYGLPQATKGRFAFRSFLEGGGPGATEMGDVVGIDSVAYVGRK